MQGKQWPYLHFEQCWPSADMKISQSPWVSYLKLHHQRRGCCVHSKRDLGVMLQPESWRSSRSISWFLLLQSFQQVYLLLHLCITTFLFGISRLVCIFLTATDKCSDHYLYIRFKVRYESIVNSLKWNASSKKMKIQFYSL